MNADAIREWLRRRPFEPFELRLSNGERYPIRHPEVIALGKTRIAVADPEKDQIFHLALIHINSIGALRVA